MPTRDELLALIRVLLDQWIDTPDEIWVALYRLLLDYEHGVPRITDSNRLRQGIWRQRALVVQQELANALSCPVEEVSQYLDMLMRDTYEPATQRMNPVGMALACSVVYLIQRFAQGQYTFKIEARIGRDVFPNLTNFRRQSVDIVAFQNSKPYAVISSKRSSLASGAFGMTVFETHRKKPTPTSNKSQTSNSTLSPMSSTTRDYKKS